jgi:hypothetical protein
MTANVKRGFGKTATGSLGQELSASVTGQSTDNSER